VGCEVRAAAVGDMALLLGFLDIDPSIGRKWLQCTGRKTRGCFNQS
jgi:hypothetical protein